MFMSLRLPLDGAEFYGECKYNIKRNFYLRQLLGRDFLGSIFPALSLLLFLICTTPGKTVAVPLASAAAAAAEVLNFL